MRSMVTTLVGLEIGGSSAGKKKWRLFVSGEVPSGVDGDGGVNGPGAARHRGWDARG